LCKGNLRERQKVFKNSPCEANGLCIQGPGCAGKQ
jgi:hypothetical protein